MKAIIPLSPDNLGGPAITVESDGFVVLASRDKRTLVKFHSVPVEVGWFQTHELMYCQQHGLETIKVIRQASDEERRRFRVPLWIQGEEIPGCCGQPMFFVGQIDDDSICTEKPPDSATWWHDAASFYVFTCSRCLACKAIGQQF